MEQDPSPECVLRTKTWFFAIPNIPYAGHGVRHRTTYDSSEQYVFIYNFGDWTVLTVSVIFITDWYCHCLLWWWCYSGLVPADPLLCLLSASWHFGGHIAATHYCHGKTFYPRCPQCLTGQYARTLKIQLQYKGLACCCWSSLQLDTCRGKYQKKTAWIR